MSTYGFPWPAMLECDKFPVDNDMCIAAQSENKNDRARLGQQQQQGQRQVPSGRGGGVRNRWGDGGGGDGDGDGGHRQEGGESVIRIQGQLKCRYVLCTTTHWCKKD